MSSSLDLGGVHGGTLLFVRHGQATAISARSGDQVHNPSLSEKGAEQVEALAASLKASYSNAKVKIFSSPMRRALETAAPIALGKRMAVAVLFCEKVQKDAACHSNLSLLFGRRIQLLGLRFFTYMEIFSNTQP